MVSDEGEVANSPLPEAGPEAGPESGPESGPAPDGTVIGLKAALSPNEQAIFAQVEVGSLDDEIRLAKTELIRLVGVSSQGEGAARSGDVILKQLDAVRKLELARLRVISVGQAGGADEDLGREDTFILSDEEMPDDPIL